MPYESIILKGDPKELEKLGARLEECRKQEKYMRSVNAFYHKHGTCRGYPDMSEETASMLDNQMGGKSMQKAPFSYGIISIKSSEIRHLLWRIVKINQKVEVTI